MGNFEELICWLNPQSLRLGVTRGGGAPTLTAQDVAAAIGKARGAQPLGAELLVMRSAPEMASLSAPTRRGMIRDIALREHCKRQRALFFAGESRLTEDLKLEYRTATRADVRVATQRHKGARAAAWPKLGPKWKLLLDLIDFELASHGKCAVCDGTGAVWVPRADGLRLRADCKSCLTTGVEQASGRRRAEAIKVSESAWRQSWALPHEWISGECESARRAAARIASKWLGFVDD